MHSRYCNFCASDFPAKPYIGFIDNDLTYTCDRACYERLNEVWLHKEKLVFNKVLLCVVFIFASLFIFA
jgi:hypothetical protein